jgi:lipopolysaccharide transport system ATP-binding protein
MQPVIQVDHLYKSYSANPRLEMKHVLQWLGQRVGRGPDSHESARHTYVLKDVSFGMQLGDSLGVAGNNGAGKTTLCRLLASVTLPTRGRIRVEGRVSSLIALGAGFHSELSGLENVYLNCALMGLNRRQVATRVEQIVEFSELGAHIDVAVKRYSSGMLARLGFSVAVHLDPEIILVDEVLSVGDYRFQVKSLAALQEFMQRGTVVFISHDLGALERLCKRALWLDQGAVMAEGTSSEVIAQYIAAQQRTVAQSPANAEPADSREPAVSREAFDDSVAVHAVETFDDDGRPSTEFKMGDTIVVRCRVTADKPANNLLLTVGLVDVETKATVTAADNQLLESPGVFLGNTLVECRFPNLYLRPRSYGVRVGVVNAKALMPLFTWRDLEPRFSVTAKRRDPKYHYLAPQSDLVFTPGAEMRYLEVNLPL